MQLWKQSDKRPIKQGLRVSIFCLQFSPEHENLLFNGVIQVLSRPFGCFLKSVPSIIPMTDNGSNLLNFKKKNQVWVCNFSV